MIFIHPSSAPTSLISSSVSFVQTIRSLPFPVPALPIYYSAPLILTTRFLPQTAALSHIPLRVITYLTLRFLRSTEPNSPFPCPIIAYLTFRHLPFSTVLPAVLHNVSFHPPLRHHLHSVQLFLIWQFIYRGITCYLLPFTYRYIRD